MVTPVFATSILTIWLALVHGWPELWHSSYESSGYARMPHKHNAGKRHHIPKAEFTVTNWSQYENGLKQRGNLTLWITPEAIAEWKAAARMSPGGLPRYSDLAIQASLMLSVFRLMNLSLAVPDHTTVSRRVEGLRHRSVAGRKARCPGPARLAHTLTDSHTDDPSQVGPLLSQTDGPITQITADGAYDGRPTYNTIAGHGDGITVAIPPRITAVLEETTGPPCQRDRHLAMIQEKGRLFWQKAVRYGKRALVETMMACWKALIGCRLRDRSLAAQKTEVAIGVAVLNRLLSVARPHSVRRQVRSV